MKGIAFYNEDFFTIKEDTELYVEAVERILMTNLGERVGRPFFGIGLKNLLFELADEVVSEIVESRIKEQVDLYLPILTITDIGANIVENSLFVNIKFIEKGESLEDERLLTLEFENEVI